MLILLVILPDDLLIKNEVQTWCFGQNGEASSTYKLKTTRVEF
jgi:hypothetical protein